MKPSNDTPLECKVGLVLEIGIIRRVDKIKEKMKEVISADSEKSLEKNSTFIKTTLHKEE